MHSLARIIHDNLNATVDGLRLDGWTAARIKRHLEGEGYTAAQIKAAMAVPRKSCKHPLL